MILGQIRIEDFLKKTKGKVRGKLVSDAKMRSYSADYKWRKDKSGHLFVSRRNGQGDEVKIKPVIELDGSILSFFGFYSGDGAKGSEDPKNPGIVKPVISISQREPNLVRFSVEQFRRIFPGSINFVFSLGEDSAFFMDGVGLAALKRYYKGRLPRIPDLQEVRPGLSEADKRYLSEKRPVTGDNEKYLAFYYFHKKAMESILKKVKSRDLKTSKIRLNETDRVTASLRRPFKKGARAPGGSSRSDEMHVGGLNGFGEFFLKILHEIEDSIFNDNQVSTQGLIVWKKRPSEIGELVNVKEFFLSNNYGKLGNERPTIENGQIFLDGQWPRSKFVKIKPNVRIDPLFCYVSGLYLAEGSTRKSTLFSMYKTRPKGFSIGFTSSENVSINLMLRCLQKLFPEGSCLDAWKIKVGSQYFPELVTIGIKEGVPMLRGGKSGDGKLRTMEISLSLKEWALNIAPTLQQYSEKYSHVEPTGAGLARIDFWASSALGKWFFPLIMYATFGELYQNPKGDFVND